MRLPLDEVGRLFLAVSAFVLALVLGAGLYAVLSLIRKFQTTQGETR